jgi:hypothetical protein
MTAFVREKPRGFIEVTLAGSNARQHLHVHSIAAYGPEQHDHGTGFVGTPIQLRGMPKAESSLVCHNLREVARKCIDAQNEIDEHEKQFQRTDNEGQSAR